MAAMPADSAYWRLGNTPFERDAAYRRLLELPMRAADVQRITAAALGKSPVKETNKSKSTDLEIPKF
jgi:hypothetical protein